MKLNTGWKRWNIHLSHLVNKKLNILELGSYKGDATSWFLINLTSNPDSKVYAVDTWKGSPEYFNTNFKEIEYIFNETIKKLNKEKQLVKMKMTTTNALLKLNINNILFDLIFIDASHEAIDVLSDAVLSWNILKENGILIFDDYKWNKLNNYHFRPKIAIDSFIDIYKTQIKILYIGYQVIIQKKVKNEFNKPIPTKYYDLMNRLNNYKIQNNISILDQIPDKILFDLKFTNKKQIINQNYVKLFNAKNKLENKLQILNKYNDLHLFIRYMNNKKKIFDLININDKLKNKSLLRYIIKFLDNNLHNAPIENILYVFNNKLLNIKSNEINFLNISHSNKHNNKIIKYFLVKCFRIKKINYYDIKYLNKSINKKIDFFIGGMEKNIVIKTKSKNYEIYYYNTLFNLIYYVLSIQNNNGIAIIGIFSLITEVTIQLLWILKKYYKEIRLTMYDTAKPNTSGNKVICIGFKGISNNELNEIYNIKKNINKKNKNNYIENILNINENNIGKYNDLKKIIKKYNIERFNLMKNNQQIMEDIIYFINKNDLSNIKKKNLINKILSVQIKYMIQWIVKYKIFEKIKIQNYYNK